MQKSWRTDIDKLTFIACLPIAPIVDSAIENVDNIVVTSFSLKSGQHDTPERMIGDVNLFLSPPDDDEAPQDVCTGELELMIATPQQRRKGLGRASILAFLIYISRYLDQILDEFSGMGEKWNGIQLRVKIGGENVKSIGLFESLGFQRVGEEINYFGEMELRFGAVLRRGVKGEEVDALKERFEVLGYKEIMYCETEN